MRVAAHQPDLLPWTGVWHKMARCEVFDLAIFDQFQTRGYQKRVLMRGSWAGWSVEGKPHRVPIREVRLTVTSEYELADTIRGRYEGSRHWATHGEWLCEQVIEAGQSRMLWQANLHLLLAVRDRLGVDTPIAIGRAPRAHGLAGLLDVAGQYDATQYLSGTGGRAYMGEEPERAFHDAGVGLVWSRHAPRHGESIVTTLMDSDDPLAEILAEAP